MCEYSFAQHHSTISQLVMPGRPIYGPSNKSVHHRHPSSWKLVARRPNLGLALHYSVFDALLSVKVRALDLIVVPLLTLSPATRPYVRIQQPFLIMDRTASRRIFFGSSVASPGCCDASRVLDSDPGERVWYRACHPLSSLPTLLAFSNAFTRLVSHVSEI